MERAWVAVDFGGLDVFREVELDIPAPGPGEVTIEVRAAGMNPADYKHVTRQGDPSTLPLHVGYEVTGVLRAIGPDTEIASGSAAVGDEVLAFRISGGYASAVTVAAKDVFAKPANLSFPEGGEPLSCGNDCGRVAARRRRERGRDDPRTRRIRSRWCQRAAAGAGDWSAGPRHGQ